MERREPSQLASWVSETALGLLTWGSPQLDAAPVK